jgi:predicted component of type VI protein secretion system
VVDNRDLITEYNAVAALATTTTTTAAPAAAEKEKEKKEEEVRVTLRSGRAVNAPKRYS